MIGLRYQPDRYVFTIRGFIFFVIKFCFEKKLSLERLCKTETFFIPVQGCLHGGVYAGVFTRGCLHGGVFHVVFFKKILYRAVVNTSSLRYIKFPTCRIFLTCKICPLCM